MSEVLKRIEETEYHKRRNELRRNLINSIGDVLERAGLGYNNRLEDAIKSAADDLITKHEHRFKEIVTNDIQQRLTTFLTMLNEINNGPTTE